MSDAYTNTAAYYDLAPIYQIRGDKDFYLARALEAPGPVLELGCGTGRVLAPIAAEGVDITGLDGSQAMLDVCRSRTSAPLVLSDMRSFELGRQFALITIPFRPFQHLYDVADQIACLECVRRHLAPGGRLIFDLYDPQLDLLLIEDGTEFLDFEFTSSEGRKMNRFIRRKRHDRVRQVIEMDLVFVDLASDARETAPLTMRYFFRYEVEHLLVRCGFAVEQVYGDFDGSPVDDRARELIFIASASQLR